MRRVFQVQEALAAFGVMEAGTGRGPRRIVAVGLAAGAAIGLAIVAGVTIASIPHEAAHKAFWTVTGPPCPQATPAQIHRIGRPLAQVVDFGEGRFSRISGAVLCTDLTDGLFGLVKGAACQFSGPRALAVGSEGGFAYFDVPDGPATVTVSRERPPRCVLAANYRGE